MRARRHFYVALVLLACGAAQGSGSAFAQATDALGHKDHGEQKVPKLGPHVFVPNTSIAEPFIASYVRTQIGLGKTQGFTVPAIDLGDSITYGELQADLTFAVLEIEYQQAIKEWLAVWIRARISARLGTSTQALISQGVTAVTGFELGWMFRVLEKEKDMLSATVNLWNNSGTFINLLDWATLLIEQGIATDLARSKRSMRGGGGVRYAHAFNDLFGFNVMGDLGWGEALDGIGNNLWTYEAGPGLSTNFADRGVPVGAYLGFSVSNVAEGGSELSNPTEQLSFDVAYTGRPDFIISLGLDWAWVDREDVDQTVVISSFSFNLRYYF